MSPHEPFHLLGATRDDLRAWLSAQGQPAYRADQLLHWLYASEAASFEVMANLPKALRAALAQRAVAYTTRVAATRISADGTQKLLVALADGEAVETVIIPEGRRRTVCVSTQVGCAIGCLFCASGAGGLVRNLASGEIVEQALHARRAMAPAHLTHLVVMGMGEPLMNLDALLRALGVFTAPWGLALGPRRVTVSTVGLPEGIRRLAAEGPGVNLAVSLHAADDVTRARLVPHARPVAQVVAAARHYLHHTGREVTFECVLVAGVNDSPADAQGLADAVGREPILVNLLPLNPAAGRGLEEPPPTRVERFVAELQRRGVRVQVRRRRGADIEGACGQLRRRAVPTAGGDSATLDAAKSCD
ncbi:MAG TPA: 23S rRNA (adenine(2503)-C(2))-methyltransferase RlmN [Planctomycetota bacterium]|nr:23S rRNA (adenine(2503)-C(2))-methyltransferase RlmN [Planctomycetota bacterium]HRR81271.1 23S rRNA (adenine(2503)-C(2))-methyltransferase RlmN [Planctomycetota bacterium]